MIQSICIGLGLGLAIQLGMSTNQKGIFHDKLETDFLCAYIGIWLNPQVLMTFTVTVRSCGFRPERLTVDDHSENLNLISSQKAPNPPPF